MLLIFEDMMLVIVCSKLDDWIVLLRDRFLVVRMIIVYGKLLKFFLVRMLMLKKRIMGMMVMIFMFLKIFLSCWLVYYSVMVVIVMIDMKYCRLLNFFFRGWIGVMVVFLLGLNVNIRRS